MPPPKSTAGYTKSAQKIKYVRNRDVKLSGKELKEEERIQKGMGEGICLKCREKLQWRFQFNKYKPLKNIANCSGCHKKCITKAYRTLCDQCAKERNVCPGCCQDFQILNEERKKRDEYLGTEDERAESQGNDENYKEAIDDEREVEGDDMEEEDVEPGTGAKRGIVENEVPTSSTIFTGTLSDWNARKFDDVVHTKYSKSRVTGSAEDSQVVDERMTSEGSMTMAVTSDDIPSPST
jgi:hypothetical protein